MRVFRATRRHSAPSPQRTPQVLPICPPPHLKSFLEETLTRAKPPQFDPSSHPQQQTAQPSASSSLARWEKVGACPGRDPGVRVFRATRRDSAPSPQRALQVRQATAPPHLKSFLEETLTRAKPQRPPVSAAAANCPSPPLTPPFPLSLLCPLPSSLPPPPPPKPRQKPPRRTSRVSWKKLLLRARPHSAAPCIPPPGVCQTPPSLHHARSGHHNIRR